VPRLPSPANRLISFDRYGFETQFRASELAIADRDELIVKSVNDGPTIGVPSRSVSTPSSSPAGEIRATGSPGSRNTA
jgi:hypothetical protein